jgi:sialate O-acetylesterase
LEGEPDFQPILERAANFSPKNPNQASVLYNGMIRPVVPLAIRGAIWYQGESNCSRAEQYQKLFPALIRDWRGNWGQGEFPFLFVQLAPYRYGNADPANCAELREAQRLTLQRVPNTGMAVTTDIGNVKDIHPKNKQEVGRRLALWALAGTYGKDLVPSGPLYESMAVESGKIRIKFKHAEGGLVAKGGALGHFTIAGADGNFVSACAEIDGPTVVVSSEEVQQPAAVRFGWRDDAEPNLFNAAGLPASPFRTDDFPMVTAGKK